MALKILSSWGAGAAGQGVGRGKIEEEKSWSAREKTPPQKQYIGCSVHSCEI